MRSLSMPRHQAGASLVLILILVLLLLLVAGGGTAGALYYTGVIGGAGADQSEAIDGADAAADKPQPPIYLPLEPPLVANFERKGRVGYLQAGMQVMARQQAAIDAVKAHLPVVRNQLLLLMSSKSYEELKNREGKEQLREQALTEINQVLEEQGAETDVEAVYFTSFVMQ